jgi:aminoglycoside phosphotransferase (APT) family kinase protein
MTSSGLRSPEPAPGLDALTAALASAFQAPVTVRERRPHPYASTFPGEIVRCETGGRLFTVLCKYEAGGRYPCFGHRGGLGYEALVYRELVQWLPLPTLTFHGARTDDSTGDTWLFLEYLGDARRPDEDAAPKAAMAAGARWAGRFHRLEAHRPTGGRQPALRVYTGEYYAQWARRTAEIAGDWHERLPWLRSLCERAAPRLQTMADLPSCAIHGEFTPHNLLVTDEEVIPIDWETAAVGVGAVDLASLTDGWPGEVADACEAAYLAARWPEGPPADHARTLDLARLYWHLRWLGDRPEWLRQAGMLRRFLAVQSIGERLGV